MPVFRPDIKAAIAGDDRRRRERVSIWGVDAWNRWWSAFIERMGAPALRSRIGVQSVEIAVIALKINRRALRVVRVQCCAGTNASVGRGRDIEVSPAGCLRAVARAATIENSGVGADVEFEARGVQ